MKKEKINWKGLLIVLSIPLIMIIGFIYLKNNENSGVYEEDNQIIGNLSKNLSSKDEIKDSFSKTDKPHWTHMPITYKIEEEEGCNVQVKERTELAFNKIQLEMGNLVSFEETSGIPDISVFCKPYFTEKIYDASGKIIRTEKAYGEALTYSYKEKENLIKNATLNFYGAGYVCGTEYPMTEIHEILHTFGFDHNYGLNDIMQPYAEISRRCKITKIDEKYIYCLKNIYSNGTIIGNCTNINFLKLCGEGYILGPDKECIKDCKDGYTMYEDYKCYPDCEEGYVMGEDYKCYEECGEGYYCIEGYTCVNGECEGCGAGYYLDEDGLCYLNS